MRDINIFSMLTTCFSLINRICRGNKLYLPSPSNVTFNSTTTTYNSRTATTTTTIGKTTTITYKQQKKYGKKTITRKYETNKKNYYNSKQIRQNKTAN